MRIAPLSRRIGSTALVLMLGLALAACGDDSTSADSADSSASPSASLSSAPSGSSSEEPSSDESSASAAGSAELSAEEFYPAVMNAMRGAETFAFSTTSGEGAEESTVSGVARFGGDSVEMKASSTGAQAMEMIMVDQMMYMKAPDMGLGEKYLKIDLSDPKSLFGMIGKATDPEVMFKAMETPEKLEFLGEEEVDGVVTNHYRITIDPTDYLKAMDFPESMAGSLPKEMVNEMWVDADNLPRKFSQTSQTPAPGGGAPVATTTQGFYSDFGKDVEISAPPADQISTQTLPSF